MDIVSALGFAVLGALLGYLGTSSPRPIRYAAIAVELAVFGGLGLAVLTDRMDGATFLPTGGALLVGSLAGSWFAMQREQAPKK
ncbi:MAG TPA: hypothetical protein VEK80_13930 [Kribbellaceae bacterium]|nr:hypothetical protein [Kribbellaceae bacterium]